jgi:uncharacterized peroxidase-related enzyme
LNRAGAFGASNASIRSKKQSREDAMSVVNPLTKDKAPTEAHGLFDALSKQFGKMPNMFGLMAHRPDVLRKFLPFYSAVMEGGTVEHRYKELAYLKTSLINACEYWTRAHTASAKRIGITEEQIRALVFYQRSKLFDEKDKAVILFADRVTRGSAAMRDTSLAELRKFFNDDQIVELTLVTCEANLTNRFNNALDAEPDLGD